MRLEKSYGSHGSRVLQVARASYLLFGWIERWRWCEGRGEKERDVSHQKPIYWIHQADCNDPRYCPGNRRVAHGPVPLGLARRPETA